MRAYRVFEDGKVGAGRLVEMETDALDPGEVLLRSAYAGVNYKDALAGCGGAPIVRRYPCNAGIEAFGVVEQSTDPRFAPGTAVIGHGRGLGVAHDGGLADYVRAPADWLHPLPEGLSLREAAALGVAGYSAALAVDRLERLGLTPGAGRVAVTGATGGVGSFAVAMLARRGFEVAAITSKPDAADWLRARGAAEVMAPGAASEKPLEKALWAGAVDATGGPQLEWLLRTTAQDGIIASIGNAAGVALSTTVLPFILRGVTLTGINGDNPMPVRERIWGRLAADLKPEGLDGAGTEIALDALPDHMGAMIEGRVTGRAIVAFGAD